MVTIMMFPCYTKPAAAPELAAGIKKGTAASCLASASTKLKINAPALTNMLGRSLPGESVISNKKSFQSP